MVEALHTEYSVRQICEVLGFNRSGLYYQSKTDPFEQRLGEEIEKLSARYPTYGYRRITQLLLRKVNEISMTYLCLGVCGKCLAHLRFLKFDFHSISHLFAPNLGINNPSC